MSKILVIYDGNNTGIMAKAITEGITSFEEIHVVLKSVDEAKPEDLIGVDAVILGSPTINENIGSKMKAFLDEIEDSQLQGKLGSAFGSYGWSGEAPGLLMDVLRRFKIDLFYPILRVKRQPNESNLKECLRWGMAIAEKVVAKQRF